MKAVNGNMLTMDKGKQIWYQQLIATTHFSLFRKSEERAICTCRYISQFKDFY